MGSGSIYHHAGLCLFFPAFLQLAGRPCIGGDRTVDQVCIIRLQFAVCFNLIAVAAFGHYFAVTDLRFSFAADLIVGAGNAEGGRNPLPAGHSHVNYAGIVGNGLVALRHHAHIARAVNIGIFNFRRSTVINIIMAAGTTDCCRSFHSHGSAHGHAGDLAVGCGADIQISCVQGSCGLFTRIGHAGRGIICNAVHTHSHHTGQEGIRAGKLQRRRACLYCRGSIRFHRNQRCLAAACCINRSIFQACRIVFVDFGIRTQTLGGDG